MKFALLLVFLLFSIKNHCAQDNEDSEFEFFRSRCDSNCTFEPYHLSSETLKAFPTKCSSVCAYMQIDQNSDVTEAQLTSAFKNMKTLYGFINVRDTILTSAKFLAGLETLECESDSQLTFRWNNFMTEIGMVNFRSTSCSIDIDKNSNLTKLNLPNLKNFYLLDPNPTRINNISADGSTEKFCITVGEMSHFLSSDFFDSDIPSTQYCNLSETHAFDINEKVCQLDNFNLTSFDSSCKRILGNVVIRAGDEEHVSKLKSVTWIYGCISIKNTNLIAIDFFDSLHYVAALNNWLCENVIEIIDNRNLINAGFPNLKRIRGGIRAGIVEGNHKKLTFNPNICIGMKNGINVTELNQIVFDGESCYKIYGNEMVPGNWNSAMSRGLFENVFLSIFVYIWL